MGKEKYHWNNLASEFHQKRMLALDTAERLIGDVRGVKDEKYMMYRRHIITPPDGGRLYEFLIEYDIYNPSQGIYLGCKSITLPGASHPKQIDKAIDDWQTLRPYILQRLNNIFINKDFSHRFCPTDNDNDRTFWPFWISIYEDEDLKEFCLPVLDVISRVYEEYFAGTLPVAPTRIPEKQIPVPTAFTHEAFAYLEERVKEVVRPKGSVSRDKEEAWQLFLSFMEKGQQEGFLQAVPGYEVAYAIRGKTTNVDFKCLMSLLFERIGKMYGSEKAPVPWEALRRVFLRPDGNAYGPEIRTQSPTSDTRRYWKERLQGI